MNVRLHLLALTACIASLALGTPSSNAELKFLGEHQSSPPATISAVEWIAGNWRGQAFGGTVEEIWSTPLDGTMMGSFKSSKDGEVSFYEFMLIRPVGGSLVLQLKHFTAELGGWEARNETVDFPLVEITEDAAYFSGISFLRVSPSEMHVFVRVGDADEPPLRIVYRATEHKAMGS